MVAAATDSDKAPRWHSVPAGMLGDTVTIIPSRRGRNLTRLVLVICVIFVTVALTVQKYVTDSSLQSGLYVSRLFGNDITEPLVANPNQTALCPCNRNVLDFADFTKWKYPIAGRIADNPVDFVDRQCSYFVYSCGKAAGCDYVSGDETVINGTVDRSNFTDGFAASWNYPLFSEQKEFTDSSLAPEEPARRELYRYCNDVLSNVVRFLDARALNASAVQQAAKGATENGTSPVEQFFRSDRYWAVAYRSRYATPSLVSTAQLTSDLTDYLAQVVRTSFDTTVAAFEAIEAIGAGGSENATAIIGSFVSGYGSIVESAAVTAAGGDVYSQIDRLLLTLMIRYTTVDWTSYKRSCEPAYCDTFQRKTVLTRLTEFLALIGGLWNTCLLIAIVAFVGIGTAARFEATRLTTAGSQSIAAPSYYNTKDPAVVSI